MVKIEKIVKKRENGDNKIIANENYSQICEEFARIRENLIDNKIRYTCLNISNFDHWIGLENVVNRNLKKRY